jgi:hypothetical protein
VTVSPTTVTVDFVRAYLPKDTLTSGRKNREIGHTYTIGSATPTTETPQKTSFFTYPNPVEEVLTVEPPTSKPYDRQLDLVNLQGQIMQTQILKRDNTVCYFDIKNTPAGMYLLRWKDDNLIYTQKVVVVK